MQPYGKIAFLAPQQEIVERMIKDTEIKINIYVNNFPKFENT